MGIVELALGLATYAAPRLAKWLGGDKAEDVANQVVGLAQSVTGVDNASAALTALKNDPAKLIEFQRQAGELEVRLYEEETKRLQAVNETIRAEAGSNDKYVRRWRPTFGYVMAATWTLQIVGTVAGMVYVVFAHPANSADILTGIGEVNGAMVSMWTVGLSVIGVSVWKRSSDKKLAAGGDTGPGLIGAIAQRIAGPGNG